MHYALTEVTEPVTLEDAKLHLSVIHDADDALIESCIAAARENVERMTGLALVSATYSWEPEGEVVPLRPSAVTLTDGVATGFTTTAVPLPPSLRAAILLIVGDLYVSRTSVSDKPLTVNPTVQALVFPHRVNLGF